VFLPGARAYRLQVLHRWPFREILTRIAPEPKGLMVWSKRGKINTAAIVTIAQCNTLVARCSRQLIGPADRVFLSHWDPYAVISLEVVAYS